MTNRGSSVDGGPTRAGIASRPWLLVLAGLLALVVVTLGVELTFAPMRRSMDPIPEPGPLAIEEPVPPGPEGTALADARAFTDVFALDDAERILVGVLRRDQKNALAHAYLARVAYRRGQMTDGTCRPEAVKKAESELAQADAIQPGLLESTLARGYLRFYAGDYTEAWRLGKQALHADRSFLRAALLMAQTAVRAGDLKQAESLASQVVRGLRGGWVFDRAMEVLVDVYDAKHEVIKLRRLRATTWWREGKDHHGRPRGSEPRPSE
ncbi:MAG: tetratricopeptide repeat protein [Deltaproteobacteria bacterium]|nr:tetratricopeptide repeat protein [Deltaproteobacteria bacterium]